MLLHARPAYGPLPGRAGDLSATRFYCGTSDSTAIGDASALRCTNFFDSPYGAGRRYLDDRYTAAMAEDYDGTWVLVGSAFCGVGADIASAAKSSAG